MLVYDVFVLVYDDDVLETLIYRQDCVLVYDDVCVLVYNDVCVLVYDDDVLETLV